MTNEEFTTMQARVAELEAEVAEWKAHAADLSKQLAAARKSKAPQKPASSTPGFDAFWSAWPASPRKVNKAACLRRWISGGLELQHEEVIAHVVGMKKSTDWTKSSGQYIPAPLVYLNQERYLAPCAPVVRASGIGFVDGIDYSKDRNGVLN